MRKRKEATIHNAGVNVPTDKVNVYCSNRKCKNADCIYYFFNSPMDEILYVNDYEREENGKCLNYKT